MHIDRIELRNYRIYYGENPIELPSDSERNLFIISGNNGYGKTTLITSLIWCLYGKLMQSVDDVYKNEIFQLGGYTNYASRNLNKLAQSEGENEYSVSIQFSDVFIPSIAAKEVKITRTFNAESLKENLEIFIEGEKNELTKELGPEVFIHDFIMPKEIAKFFFFDAEKIVSLAEIKSVDDKRALSEAYSEVLGIKKYELLRQNLQNIRLRLKRNFASEKEKEEYEYLLNRNDEIDKLTEITKEKIQKLQDEKIINYDKSQKIQEKLIREGSTLTSEELFNLREEIKKLMQENQEYKEELKRYLDFAPFAIAGKQLKAVKRQVEKEHKSFLDESYKQALKNELMKVKKSLKSEVTKKIGQEKAKNKFHDIVDSIIKSKFDELSGKDDASIKLLHNFDSDEYNKFKSVFRNLTDSYSNDFKDFVKKYNNNKIKNRELSKKLSDAETKEKDEVISRLRNTFNELEKRRDEIDNFIISHSKEIGGLSTESNSNARLLSELSKKINLHEVDLEKDKTIERIIEKLQKFLIEFKNLTKDSLRVRIKNELKILMHKKDFIEDVKVEIDNDMMDIHLLDNMGDEINKESLSKGEQQLYATAVLKALVDESNIEFPVFIDSPLQKFDYTHSRNIILEFYPHISKQVVIFPLIEKELSQEEFQILEPRVNSIYKIYNVNSYKSELKLIKSEDLFNDLLSEKSYV